MGVFFATQPAVSRTTARDRLRLAFEEESLEPALAIQRTEEALGPESADGKAGSAGQFYAGRFFGAVVLFALLVGAGIFTEVSDLGDSSKALFGFAGTVFGVVTTLLSVESKEK